MSKKNSVVTDEIVDSIVVNAAREYLMRKNRTSHPSGRFDNAQRFFPDQGEHRPCCTCVRSPSRAYPYSLMTHCRSAEHVANLYDVDASALRRAARKAMAS